MPPELPLGASGGGVGGGGEVAVKGGGCLLSDTYTHVQMN